MILKFNQRLNYFGMWFAYLVPAIKSERFDDGAKISFYVNKKKVRTFAIVDLIASLNSHYVVPTGREDFLIYSGFVNFNCPYPSCFFNKMKIEATTWVIYTDNHTIEFPKDGFDIAGKEPRPSKIF